MNNSIRHGFLLLNLCSESLARDLRPVHPAFMFGAHGAIGNLSAP